MRNSFYLIISLFLFNSCAFHSGVMTSSTSLTNGDFVVVKTAIGTAKTTHVLGIGGLKRDAIVYEAKKDLLRRSPLKKGQVLANVSVDFKRTYLFIVVTTKATLTADIIDFNLPDEEMKFGRINYENLNLVDSTHANLSLGDSVFVILDGKPKRSLIISFEKNKVRVMYQIQGVATNANPDGDRVLLSKVHITNLKEILVFKESTENTELYGFDVGEKVGARISKKKYVDGVIFGINSYQAGVKYNFKEDGSFDWDLVPLSDLNKL